MSQADYRVIQQMNIGTYSSTLKRTNRSAYLELGDSLNSTKALLLPRGDTANVLFPIKGLMFFNLADSGSYEYDGIWRKLRGGESGSENIYNTNGILTGNRTLSGLNNTYSLLFDSLNSFVIERNNKQRIYMDAGVTSIISPNGNNLVGVEDGFVRLMSTGASNEIYVRQDSTWALKKLSYPGNIHGLFFPYSLVDKSYVDSVAGGGTPTFQQVLTAGSTMTGDNTVTQNGNKFKFTSSGTSATVANFQIEGTGSNGLAMSINTLGKGLYINGSSAGQTALEVDGYSTGFTARFTANGNGTNIYMDKYSSTTNAIATIPATQINRLISGGGTADVGIGFTEDKYIQTTSGSGSTALQHQYEWTNATAGAQTALYTLKMASGGSLAKRFAFHGSGYIDQIEMSAPSTPASNFGRWYVSSSDSKPHFITDGGTDYDLTATGGSGTVTSVAAGFGTSFTTITSTGSVIIDTTSGGVTSWVRTKKVIDSLAALSGSSAISALTVATATNTINNANYTQEWQWNSLAGVAGLKLSSNSTAAASNLQRLFEIDLSGANSNSGQTSHALYVNNIHTGSSSTNVGASIGASGGTTNIGAIINATEYGAQITATGTGSFAVYAHTTAASGTAGDFDVNSTGNPIAIQATAQGVADNNIGVQIHTINASGRNDALKITAGEFLLPEVTAPGTPPSGFVTIYQKTDGKLYSKNDAGTEYDLTASGTIGGSIASTQVAVGSVANTVSGSADLTFSGGTLNVGNTSLYTGTGSDITAAGYASGSWWISSIRNSQAYSITPSAGYLASVKYNAAGDYTEIGGIAWAKENAVDGEYGSRMFFYTRPNGGSMSAGFEMNADQEILIGNAGADAGDIKLQVVPKTASEFGMLIRLQAAATADAWQVQNSSFTPLGFLSASGLLYGVTGAYGTSSTPSAKAILDLGSTTQGFLPPRMSDAQRTAITSVPAALLVWDTDSSRYMGYDGANWRGIAWTGEAGGGGGYTNLTQFVAQTAHRLFYSDGSGDVQELAFGSSGEYLKSNGSTSAPSWDTPAGSGTINSGTTGKPAYYVGATTLDDFAAVDYATSGTNVLITTQNTTDVGLEIKGISSQSANLLNISSSAGTGDLAIITAAGASRFTSLKIGTASTRKIELFANGEALFTSDATATLQDPDAFDNTHQIFGDNNTRFLVSSGSGYDHRLVNVTGNLSAVYTGFVDGGGVIMETNQALNFGTNKTVKAIIAASGALKLTQYGSGTFTGTATKFLAVDASGNIIEENAPGGASTFAGLTDVNLTSITTEDFLKWNGTDWINRSPSQVKSDLTLNLVENTALSTWAGTANITTLGTIGTGTWQGGVISSTYGGTGVNNGGRTLTINTNNGTISFTSAVTLTVANTASVSGTNTGDQTTVSGNAGTATALQNTRTIWGQNFDGTANVTGSLTAITDMTGGASNMVITSGTGASRTMTLRTTTAGSTATTALTLAADQSATFAASVTGTSFIPSGTTVPSNGLYLPAANTVGWAANSTIEMQLTSTALSPGADGGNSLGTTALGWQNLFGNTGFVFNIENGDWVATHTAGILTVGTGDLRVTNNFTNATSVLTLAGAQTITNKSIGATQLTGDIATARMTLLKHPKSISLQSPTSSENVTLFFTEVAITVTNVTTVMIGSSQSVTYVINYGDSRATADGTIVASNTFDSGDSGYQTTGFAATLNTTSIPAGTYIWLTTSATSGTINDWNVTLTYTVN